MIRSIVNSWWVEGRIIATRKFCNSYLIYVFKMYFQLLSWQKILPTLWYKHFFLKPGNLIIKWLLLSSMPHAVLKDYPRHLTKYEDKGTWKIPIFHLFYEFVIEKTWNYTQPKINISKSNFEMYAWIGESYVRI